MYKFESINQFRSVIKYYKYFEKIQHVKYVGTVKIYGTNAGLVYDCFNKKIKIQSRNRVLTVEDDNAEFASFVCAHMPELLDAFEDIVEMTGYADFIAPGMKIAVYGEWAGPGINSGVAVNSLSHKMFFPFNIVFINDTDEKIHIDVATEKDLLACLNNSFDIYSIYNFGLYFIKIDFNNPENSQNELINITNKVEELCPVGAFFGITGTGEGVVWRPQHAHEDTKLGDVIFKVKGQKHSVSKVKNLSPVDTEKIAKVSEFINYAVTENRLKQGLECLKEMKKPIDNTSTGDFVRWLVNDVIKEELDTITESGLDTKMINKKLSQTASKWYISNID